MTIRHSPIAAAAKRRSSRPGASRGILADGSVERLDATALCEVWLADISSEALIAVLNDPDELEARFLRGKTLIGFVMED